VRLSQRCFAVTGLAYSPPWSVNAGFVAGDGITLVIDTGANTLAARTIHGYASAASPANRLRVVNTEKHFDHIGGNSFFRTLGIGIWGHAGIARTPAEFQAEIGEFNAAIPNPARRAAREAEVFFEATTLANPDRPIQSGTRMDLGACSAEILLTPGHTSTNLSVWIPSEGVIYTGDCLIAGYLPNLDAAPPGGWRAWLGSLRLIESLQPAIVVAGHGPVARGPAVARMIAAVRRVLEESLESGSSPTAP
jgi:glyoxylase-like metal-dependent hydrolase (beta-lactamase superfamily II)